MEAVKVKQGRERRADLTANSDLGKQLEEASRRDG